MTVVHSKTKDAQAICAEADILIAAIGKAEMVKADWVKPGAAVIDVGTNPIPVRPSRLALQMSHTMCVGVCLAGPPIIKALAMMLAWERPSGAALLRACVKV